MIATWLWRKATTLARARLHEQLEGQHYVQAPPAPPLPEAPASANCYITIAGRNVQLTLRDHNEEHLLKRMEQLLARFPVDEQEQAEPPEGWCPLHQVHMKLHSNGRGS